MNNMKCHKPVKFKYNALTWYYQLFTETDAKLSLKMEIRLYREDGEFVKEFSSFEEMREWIAANEKNVWLAMYC